MERKDLSLEQEFALQLFENGENVFLTGPGGTGKTCLIKLMTKKLNKKTVICAMTGCAAILLNCGAITLHSWSGIRLGKGTSEELFKLVSENRNSVKRWRNTQALILDEVSMLSKKLFDTLDLIGRRLRNQPNIPFGGIQLVFVGDFYQLPPVGNKDDESSMFCFESNRWYETFPLDNHVQLTTLYRQNDAEYKNILNNIRIGNITPTIVQRLNSCVNRKFDKNEHNGCIPTKLFAIKRKVDEINNSMFNDLEETPHEFDIDKKSDCFTYIESGKPILQDTLNRCKKELNKKKIDMEFDYLINNCPCEQKLVLKVGANVMCTVNLDIENGICNGSIGTVIKIVKHNNIPMPLVQFSNGITRGITCKYWQSEEYPTIAIGQVPLKLAWAMTIHKIQGATLSMAEVDIGSSIFECGQTYVALSRVQSLKGLYLTAFNHSKIFVNNKVRDFYKKIPVIEFEEEIQESKNVTELDLERFKMDDTDIKTIILP
jgi:ATP-dependent DNA helicase PIF1